ncbi:MAG: c-type cytochrome [Gammaproteobacteria bacterium]
MRRVIAGLLLLLVVDSALASGRIGGEAVERGRYILAAAGCEACHTIPESGDYLAGGRRFETPFGVFFSPNITPDARYGIGSWDLKQFAAALKKGVGPDGHYFPVFPFTSYTHMRDQDIGDLWAYLRSVPPIARPVPSHQLPWYLGRTVGARIWNLLFFDETGFAVDPGRSKQWNRGAYLVSALGHCAECHSPRWPWGAIREEQRFAGTESGPEGKPVPNITPDRETGIGRWSEDDIVWYLESGGTPDGDYAGGLMAEVVDHSTSRLSDEDRKAIALFLKSIPAVHHSVGSGDQ